MDFYFNAHFVFIWEQSFRKMHSQLYSNFQGLGRPTSHMWQLLFKNHFSSHCTMVHFTELCPFFLYKIEQNSENCSKFLMVSYYLMGIGERKVNYPPPTSLRVTLSSNQKLIRLITLDLSLVGILIRIFHEDIKMPEIIQF